MKSFILVLSVFFIGFTQVNAQLNCMSGPGTNGTYTDCDQGPVNYNVSDCECEGAWRFAIDGIVDIDANSNLPLSFNTGNIAGTVVSASSGSLTVNWDCSGLLCCEGFAFTTIEYCGSEFFNPIIRLTCVPDDSCDDVIIDPPTEPCDTFELKTCITTPCECLKVCINGQVEILNNSTGGDEDFCWPAGTIIGEVTDCESELVCKGVPHRPLDFNIVVPNATITSEPTLNGGFNLALEIPNSDTPFEIVISDLSGRVLRNQKVQGPSALINLNDLTFGVYFAVLTNGTTTITHKFIYSDQN